MAGPMKADKAQVRQMARDIERAYMLERSAARGRAFDAEKAIAQKFADEINRRAAEYGYTANARPMRSQGGGWSMGWMVDHNVG